MQAAMTSVDRPIRCVFRAVGGGTGVVCAEPPRPSVRAPNACGTPVDLSSDPAPRLDAAVSNRLPERGVVAFILICVSLGERG
jgi:hypothetical protein